MTQSELKLFITYVITYLIFINHSHFILLHYEIA